MNELTFENGEICGTFPRCLWFTIPGGFVGYRFDGYIYFAKCVPSADEMKKRPYVWGDNQPWWIARITEDQTSREYIYSRFPKWLNIGTAKQVLSCSYKELGRIQSRNDGRYSIGRDIAENQRDLLRMLNTSDRLENVQYTLGAKLLYNNNESIFTGHPLQIWSDGVWTHDNFLTGFGRKSAINKDAETLLKFAGKKLALQIGIEKILSITWCNKREIAKASSSAHSFSGHYSEEYRLEEWETSIRTFYLLFWEWGAMGEDGDAGDDCDVFLTHEQAQAALREKAK